MTTPNNQLQWRINSTVDYLTVYWGLPAITAKTIVLNVIGTLVSSYVRVEWYGENMGLWMTLVVAPGIVDENRGYADFLAVPMNREIERLKQMAEDDPNFVTKCRALEKEFQGTPKDDPKYPALWSQRSELMEAEHHPLFMLRTLPNAKHRSRLFSTLIMDDRGDVIRQALADGTGSQFTKLGKGFKVTEHDHQVYGTVLEAPPEGFGQILGSVCSQFWQPVILPGANSLYPKRYQAPERAMVVTAWSEAVAEALAIRRGLRRIYRVTDYGSDVLNRVIKMAEAKTKSVRHRGKFGWVAKVTVKLAGIYHLLFDGQPGDITQEAWDAAEAHMKDLIDAHAGATDVIVPRVEKAKAFNGRPTDARTFTDYMLDHPKASLRDIVRYLPHREPGYWKVMYEELKGGGSPTEG